MMKELKAETISGQLTGISGDHPITLTIDGEKTNILQWLQKHLGYTIILVAVGPPK